jgi:hypothetical protein
MATAVVKTGSGRPFRSWWSKQRPAPLAWRALFTDLTEGEFARQWALAAGLFIAHHHRRHATGPTFRELFDYLFPDTGGDPSQNAEEWDRGDFYLARQRFRMGVIIAWARLGYIEYDGSVPNSLRPGRSLRTLIQRDERVRSMAGDPASPEPSSVQHAALQASLSPEQAVARIRTTRCHLDRMTDAGLLHAVGGAAGLRYPAWQFSADSHQTVVSGIPLILSSMPRHWTLARIHRFFTTPTMQLRIGRQSQTPAQWLRQGADPMEVAILLEGYSFDID